jgi:6-pyruvoyltetrahydropterin/6-carboxytetrahydropterin synthase
MKVTFHRVFSAAHRLHGDPSKCQNIHGHNYRVSVVIDGVMPADIDMMVPFDRIKEVVDDYDHALILDQADPLLHDLGTVSKVITTLGRPTTEIVAQTLADEVAIVVRRWGVVAQITIVLAETDNIVATCTSHS